MKKILYIIFSVIVFVMLVFNIFSMTHLSMFGYRVYRIGSGSMEPTLKTNSLIIVKESDSYKVNDIVTYKQNGEYITHRIVEIDGDSIITQGDANNIADVPISKDMIVGKVVGNFMKSGFANYLLLRRFTWVLIFLMGASLIIFAPSAFGKRR